MTTQTPDEELIAFADFFSANYHTLTVGTYTSSGGKYVIDYVDSDKFVTFRVNSFSHRMELNRKALLGHLEYAADYVFYSIIWLQFIDKSHDIDIADEKAALFYMTTDRPVKIAALGICRTFMSLPSDENIKRLKKLSKHFGHELHLPTSPESLPEPDLSDLARKLTHKLSGIASTREVFLDGIHLLPNVSQKYQNHSPNGFNWGYNGSGPAQLALAVMLKLTGKADGYQAFKERVIAPLPGGEDFNIEFTL